MSRDAAIVLAGCFTTVRYVGGVIIYVWTVYMTFSLLGVFWGVVSIFFPGLATVAICLLGLSLFGFAEFFIGSYFGLAVLVYLAALVAPYLFLFVGAAYASRT